MVKECVSMDKQSPKYNIYYHQLLSGVILKAFSVYPDKIIEWLMYSQLLERYLTVQQQLVSINYTNNRCILTVIINIAFTNDV